MNWDLLLELIRTNFKLKYKGSVLGFIWVLIKPLLIFLLLFVFFSKLSNPSGEISKSLSAVNLLVGIVFFYLFNEGVIWGMNSLLDKANIILKINFNRLIAVASSVAMALINFGINIFILTLMAIYAHVGITFVSFLYLLLIVICLLLVITSVSLFSSVLLVKLRDLTHVAELAIQLLFYASAIFYPIDIVPEKWRFLITYNPLAIIIDAARKAIVYGEVTRVDSIMILFVVSLVATVVAWRFFISRIKKIAEYF